MEQVDALTGDRDQAIEEALRLWCAQRAQQIRPAYRPTPPRASADSTDRAQQVLIQSAQQHRQRHDNDETGWLV